MTGWLLRMVGRAIRGALGLVFGLFWGAVGVAGGLGGGALGIAVALVVVALVAPIILGVLLLVLGLLLVLAVVLVPFLVVAVGAVCLVAIFGRHGFRKLFWRWSVFGDRGTVRKELAAMSPLRLEAGWSDVQVRPGEPGKILVTCSYKVGWGAEDLRKQIEVDPPIEVEGNTVRLGDLKKYGLRGWEGPLGSSVDFHFTVEVPAETELALLTGSGDQGIYGLRRPVKSQAGSGDVEIREVAANVEAETGSGDIELHGIQGDVNCHAGSGDVELADISGQVMVHTGSGDVDLRGARKEVRIATGSGDVFVDAKFPPSGEWSIETGSGDVTLRLPTGSQFKLVYETSSGELDCDFPVMVSKGGRWAEARVGDNPTAVIHVETSSGDLEVEKS